MEFDIIDSTITLTAKRNSGKSQMVMFLLDQYHHMFDKIIIISKTEPINKFYQQMKFIDPKFIYDKYDESFIKTLMNNMAKKNEGLKKGNPKMKHVLLVLDDICSSFNTHSSKTLESLFSVGRHYGLTTILIAQYVKMIPPIVRTNTDYILVSQMNKQGVDIITQEYLFGNIDNKELKELYLKNTSDYGFLIINSKCADSNDNLNAIYGRIKVPEEFIKNK